MKSLEADIQRTDELLGRLPALQVRALDKSLRELDTTQRRFVADTLSQAESNQLAPPRQIHFLEHFFDKWSAHSLATKLVLIDYISRLASKLESDSEFDEAREVFTLLQSVRTVNG